MLATLNRMFTSLMLFADTIIYKFFIVVLLILSTGVGGRPFSVPYLFINICDVFRVIIVHFQTIIHGYLVV